MAKCATFVSEGAIAQLGERYAGSVEVDGSIPSGSTISRVFHALFNLFGDLTTMEQTLAPACTKQRYNLVVQEA